MSRLVVLDTNCLVQMLSVHSPYRPGVIRLEQFLAEISK